MIDNYITGSNGFIGSYLAKRLADQNTVSIPHDDIGKIPLEDCRRVFFLSTYGNMAFHDNTNRMIAANVLDMLELLNEPKDAFIYVSSSSVNLDVQTPYSRCKRAAEEILLIKRSHPVIIVRPYSVTGVREQPEHLIPKLIHCAFTGETMPFCPEPTHDFIDAEDVVEAMLLLANHAKSGIYEVGTGVSASNLLAKQIVEHITGKKIKTSEYSARAYDNKDWRCESRLVRSLGWVPNKSLPESIEAMVAHYKATHV